MDNMNRYVIFYEVAKCKSITRASEILFISQPAISQTIKKLEEELGVTLFIRNKKGVELTSLGKEIFLKVEEAMLTLQSVEQLTDEENNLIRGSVVVGSGSNVARELLVTPIKNFLVDFPHIQVTQTEGVQTEMFDLLKKGEVDLVISQANPQITEFPFYPLIEHKYIFIKKHGSTTTRFIKISKGSFAHQLFEEFEEQYPHQTQPDVIVSGYRMAIELVKLGVGITLVPVFLVQNELEKHEVEIVYSNHTLPTITFGYYINPAALTAATKKFVQYLKL